MGEAAEALERPETLGAVDLVFANAAASFALPAPETRMLLRTDVAPAAFAMRVITPLCCATSVVPLMVAMPRETETVKRSDDNFDFASFV